MCLRCLLRGFALFGAAAACAACGAGTHRPLTSRVPSRLRVGRASLSDRLELGAFAGYTYASPVSSITASWRVPRILAGSRAGQAATWIGASAPGATADAPFIQIGVVETRTAGGRDLYTAFWSDTRRHFALEPLFPVGPGQAISTGLKQMGGSWRVSIRDAISGRGRRFLTDDEPGRFDAGQIFQEDTSVGQTGRLAPYPSVAPVAFRGIEVDDSVLNYRTLISAWMSENGHLLAPGELYNDGFGLHIAHPSRDGVTYLHLRQRLYRAIDAYQSELATWGSGTPPAEITASSRQLSAALAQGARKLRGHHWSASVAPQIGILVSRLSDLQNQTITIQHATGHGITSARADWRGLLTTLDGSDSVTSADLNLPGATPQPN